jgi:hypothetical protein
VGGNAVSIRLLVAVVVAGAALLFSAGPASALGGPLNVTPPSISGSVVQGQTVTCSPGTWQPAPTGYSYSWQRNATTTIGGTGDTYTLTLADVNQAITCQVVARDVAGSSLPAVSIPPVVPVVLPVAATPLNTSPPVISGTAQQGQTVRCSTGAWTNSPTGYAYSWQRSGSSIAGQTGSQYALTSADVNQVITCTVLASNTSGSSSALSPPIVPVSLPVGTAPVNAGLPAISGTAQAGRTVACSQGSWLNAPTSYTYAWQRDAQAIAGQAASQYTLTSSDAGQAITCSVAASNSSGDSLPAVSLPIIPANAATGGGGSGGGSGGSGGGSGGTGGKPGGTGGKPGGQGGGTKLHAPTIRTFSVTPRNVVLTVRGKRKTTKGAMFRYSLDQRAGVLLEVQQRLTGRVKGKRCVATTKRNRRSKPCTRYVTRRVFTIKSAKAGAHQLKYLGHVGKHLFAPGAYRTSIVAINLAGWSKVRSATFMVRRHVTRRPHARKHSART